MVQLSHPYMTTGKTITLKCCKDPGKDPDAGKDWWQEEKGAIEDEMIRWHHRLNGHEFEQTLGDGEGQGSLTCCCPWGCKESTWPSDWTATVTTNDLTIPLLSINSKKIKTVEKIFVLLCSEWHYLHAGKNWRQEEKRTTEDEMVGWHRQLNGHEFEQTLGDGEGQQITYGLQHCSQCIY